MQERKLAKIVEGLNPSIFGEDKKLRVGLVKHIGRGYGHANYLILVNHRKYLLRIATQHWHDKENVEREYKRLKSVERFGIAPKVYYKDVSGREINPFLILDYVEGVKIRRLSDKDLKELAILLARLHSIRSNSAITINYFSIGSGKNKNAWMKNNVERICKDKKWARFTNKSFKTALEREYAKAIRMRFKKTRLSIIHSDPGGENILHTKDGVKLIDWEDVGLGAPQFDIATVLYQGNLRGRARRIFLDAYRKNVKRRDALSELRKYEQQRYLGRVIIGLSNGFAQKLGEPEAVKGYPTRFHIEHARTALRRCKSVGLFKGTRLIVNA